MTRGMCRGFGTWGLVLCIAWPLSRMAAAQTPTVRPVSTPMERHLDSLLAQLSLADKLVVLGGEERMFTHALPAIGLPRLLMSDGPSGVGTWGPSTAYAAGVIVAATWDPALAARLGAAIAADAKARGVAIMLGPGVNLAREPLNGRNFEYFGEDPWLASRMAVGYIQGMQRQGVIATIKHFAANNVETDRHTVDVQVDERTLRELYLPAFEAAVREAHVGAVMSSYNRLNGVYSTQSHWLNQQVLKGEWGFDGLLMSDWGATYDGVGAANGGLDVEMPAAEHMTPDTLRAALDRGAVTMATIDDKVRRLMRLALRFGYLDGPTDVSPTPRDAAVDPGAASTTALDVARAGIVLLKNAGGALPLVPSTIRTLAVIGPNATPAIPTGGGSGAVQPTRVTSFLQGIDNAAGTAVRVLYARGLPDPIEVMQRTRFDAGPNGGPGLTVERYATPDWSGVPTEVRHVRVADQWVSEQWGPRGEPTSVRWRGRYTPATSGAYLLLVGAGDNDSYTLYVNDRPVVTQPERDGQALASATLQLRVGQPIDVRLDYVQRSDRVRAGFGIVALDSLVTDEAKRIAAEADAAVVCVGFDQTSESEGFDRTFGLPWGQDQLIQTIAAANRRTIVTLTAGGGVDMAPWIDQVPAVLHTWYAGQDGGTALAEILLGARSPEGKLPITIDRVWRDNPVSAHDTPVEGAVGTMPRLVYAESLMVGYRYYTTANRTPRFPFGFGLSYTTFALTNLHAPQHASATAGVDVTVDVANTGTREGAEVVQLYVGDPSARVRRPAKELKAFQKVHLAPGERRTVTLHLDRRSFAYYDVMTHAWRVDPGQFILSIGTSSTDTPLRRPIAVVPQ